MAIILDSGNASVSDEVSDMQARGAFAGDLKDFHLVELIQVMALEGRSGALELTVGNTLKGRIYFEQGALDWCQDLDQGALTLGMILQQLGLVTKEAIEQVVASSTHDPFGGLLGEQLVQYGKLSDLQLKEALKIQQLWTMRDLSLLEQGRYSLDTHARSPVRASGSLVQIPPLDATTVNLEIVRYQYAWNDLINWLPNGMRTELHMVEMPPEHYALEFPPQVWRVISHVNACHTPRIIANTLHQQEMDVARLLGTLVKDGLLIVVSSPLPEEPMLRPSHTATPPAPIDLFTLIARIHQEWVNRRTALEELLALGTFVNWMMLELEQSWRQQRLQIAPDALFHLLDREHCLSIGATRIRVVSNRIDTDDLATQIRKEYQRALGEKRLNDFKASIFKQFQRALTAMLLSIMRHNKSAPQQNAQDEQTWNDMFDEMFHLLMTR